MITRIRQRPCDLRGAGTGWSVGKFAGLGRIVCRIGHLCVRRASSRQPRPLFLLESSCRDRILVHRVRGPIVLKLRETCSDFPKIAPQVATP